MSEVQFHPMPDGRRIAFRITVGTKGDNSPTLVFLPGYMSDMAGGKATALFAQAEAQGRSCLLVDYSGCGMSDGDFADGTLSRWRDEVLVLIDTYVTGDVLLVGSSMGGWLMLLVGEALGNRLAGMIGIAPAPDFTRWGYSDMERALLTGGETFYQDNPYGPEPTPTYPGFFEDAERNLRLSGDIAIACPVHLLHGQRDADVPWEISLKLAAALRSDNVQVTVIKDGDHRLSRESDIARLTAEVDRFYAMDTP